jgi:hypothetical protein
MLNESTVVPSTRTEWRMLIIAYDFSQPVDLGRSRTAKLGLILEMTLDGRAKPSASMGEMRRNSDGHGVPPIVRPDSPLLDVLRPPQCDRDEPIPRVWRR